MTVVGDLGIGDGKRVYTPRESICLSERSHRCEKNAGRRSKKDKLQMANTWPEMWRAWPKHTVLIVANEFFQKFASLGTVLTLYLLNGLKMSANSATIYFNVYQLCMGLVPLVGSILADGYIGKYNTILYASMLYAVGKVIMAGASVMNYTSPIHPWLDTLGIAIIVIGSGGIVPCVASFGGDQFEPHQERMISVFFSVFYAAINSGALFSTYVLPILRSQSCLGQDSCYPLSFAVSAFFMVFASALFVIGSRWYKKQPPEGNVFGDVWKTSRIALQNKSASTTKSRAHWLDYYLDTHDCRHDEKCLQLQKRKRDPERCDRKKFIADIKSLLRILVMYLPLPMFWALYDQQYSIWLIQSVQMDCRLWGDWLLLPDQMQVINPILILVFIALFESVVYPVCSYFFTLTPLRKMVAGGVIASFAFVISAGVQLKVDTTLPDLPKSHNAFVSFMNTFDNCTLGISLVGKDGNLEPVYLPPNTTLENNKLLEKKELFNVPAGSVSWEVTYTGVGLEPDCKADVPPKKLTYSVESKSIYYIYVGKMGSFMAKADPEKPTGGTGEFSIAINAALDRVTYESSFALCRNNSDGEYPCNPDRGEDFYYFQYSSNDESHLTYLVNTSSHESNSGGMSDKKATIYEFKPVRPGVWNLFYLYNSPREGKKAVAREDLNIKSTNITLQIEGQGGVYLLLLTGSQNNPQRRVFKVVPDNSVSILWQIPQIAVITAAEILFSITGYEFAYSQSATSMKSLMQALWFLTVAGGDFIIILVALVNFQDMALQFLIYAVVMLIVIFIFALLSIFYYEYKVYEEDEDHESDFEDDDDDCSECGKKNGMTDLTSKNKLNGNAAIDYGSLNAGEGFGLSNRQKNGHGNGLDNKAFDHDEINWKTKV